MSDFMVRIRAWLDTSEVEKQLKDLENSKKVKLGVDTGNTQKNIENVNKSINVAKKSSQSFGDTLKKSLNIGSVAAITAKGFRLINTAAEDAVKSVKDIDAKLTQIQIVTGASGDALKQYASDAAAAAKEIGASITEIIESTETFARLGYSLSDSLDLSKLVGQYANVAATTIDDATESLTSIMKAFNIAPSEMGGVVDELVKVGQEYAISASELGQALQNGGAALEAGGNTLEQSIALLAAGNAAVQNASAVGNALKVTSMRIRSSTAELEEMGETVDDLVTSTSNYRAEIKALSGVDIMLDENTYKSTYQVLEEIAGVWDSLSDIEQATLLEDLAGKRNANTIKSVITNLQDLEGAYQAANNATGTLAVANETYMDSIAAKAKVLQVSFEQLSINTLDSGLVKGILDALNAVVVLIDKTNLLKGTLAGLAAAGAIKGFTVLVTGISNAAIKLNEFNSALKLVKAGNIGEAEIEQLAKMTANLSKSQLKAVLSSKALTVEQRIGILTAQGLTEEEAKAALSTMGLATAEGTATGVTYSFMGALKGLWATLIANPLVLVVAGVTAATMAYSNYKQGLKDTAQAAAEQTQKTKSSLEALEDLKARVDDGAESADTLSAAFRNQLKEMGYTQEEIDILIAKYGSLADAIDAVTEKTRAQTLADAQAEVAAQKKAAKGEFGWFKNLHKGSGVLGYFTAPDTGEVYNWYDDVKFFSKQEEKQVLESADSLREAYNKAQNGTIEDIVAYKEKLQETYEQLKNAALFDKTIYDNFFYKAVEEQLTYVNEKFGDFIDAVKYADSIAVDNVADATKDITEETKNTAEILEDTAVELKTTFADVFKNSKDEDTEFSTYIEKYIDDVTKLKSALADLSEDGIESKDLEELQRTFPELAVSGDKLDGAIRSLIETKNKDALFELGKAIDGIVDEEDKAKAEAYKETLISFGEIPVPAILNISESIDKFEKSKDVLKSASEEMEENGEIANDTLKSIIELMDEGENYIDYLDIENGKIKLNTDAWEARAKAAIAADIAKLESERKQIERENDTLKENLALLSVRSTLSSIKGKPIPVALFDDEVTNSENIATWNKELEDNATRLDELASAEEVLKALNQTIEDAFNSAKSSSEKSSSKTTEESRKTFDWIETALDRIQRKVDSFSKAVSSRFKKLSSRQDAAKDEISAITQQIGLQEKAYKKYIELAESVNLSDDIKKRIREGSIEITEYDEKTAELIDKYMEMYEASIDCKNEVDDLHESLASLYEDEFNRLQTEFENRISLLEYLSNMYNTGMSTLEANGYMAGKEFYSALTTVTERNVELLKEELSSLEGALQSALNSGEIEKYSESWYQQVIAINGVKESIASATQQLAEYAREMRQIDWSYFDFLQDRISDITAESEFLIDLLDNNKLFDDSGKLTNEGMSVLGLHAVDYNVLMAQADKYAEEMRKIEQELANDPYNTDLIERRQELLELQRESIIAAEDEKQAIIDLVQNGIEEELDKLKELIDAYKDALDSAKDLHDYEKRINDQTSKLAAIDKQIQSLSGDDSEENQATLQKLYADRAEALANLKETEYDRYISEQKKLLDNLYNKYESLLNQRLDNVDVLISEMISTVNLNSDTIGQTIQTTASNVGYTLTDSMRQIWTNSYGNMQNVVVQYGQGFLDTLTTTNSVLQQIFQQVANMQSFNNNWANNWIGGTNNSFIPDSSGWTPGGMGNNTDWNNNWWDDGDITLEDDPIIPSPVQSSAVRIGDKIYAGGAMIYRGSDGHSPMMQYYGNDPYYIVLGEQNGYYMVRHHSKANGVTGWFRKQDVFKAYKKGGLVDYTGLAQVDGTPTKPESFLNAEDTQNVKGFTDELRKANKDKLYITNSVPAVFGGEIPELMPLPISDISNLLSELRKFENPMINQPTSIDMGGINIDIDHVQDYNDLVTQMRNDPKFEKMMSDMIIGRIYTNNPHIKYKTRWK